MAMATALQPSLKNLTDRKFGVIPAQQNEVLQELGAPHVDSFNFMIEQGLDKAKDDLVLQYLLNDDKLKFAITKISIDKPRVPLGTICKDKNIYPTECRQRAATYRGKLMIKMDWWLNDIQQEPIPADLGEIPIMVKSNKCHLHNMTPEQLVKAKEHEEEWGGYFIVKGNEKLIRMLLMTRRNYPIAIERNGWKDKGKYFSNRGVLMRCVKEDNTATTNILHYLSDGMVKLNFTHNKTPFYVPIMLILKCLCDHRDDYILYKKCFVRDYGDNRYKDCIMNMMRQLHEEGIGKLEYAKNYLGKMFRVKYPECPPWYTDSEVTDYILKNDIMIHLDTNEEKFDMLVFMMRKLFVFATDECQVEGADCVMMQEVLQGGHLYLTILKEKLRVWLERVRSRLRQKAFNSPSYKVVPSDVVKTTKYAGSLTSDMEYFLATGNISSKSGLGLMQNKGLVIMAENINRLRYMSHFKSVHRGAFFQEMRTTEVRKLLPDAWGFICPVHTPDGTPCGLLNHLTSTCFISKAPDAKILKELRMKLLEYGMLYLDYTRFCPINEGTFVILDGKVVGFVFDKDAAEYVKNLRILKIRGQEFPNTMEIVHVPKVKFPAQYAGIFLFTGPSRMMRPVLNLSTRETEFIGTFEQVYLEVAATPSEIHKGLTTHLEISKTDFLSHLARLIPLPDSNQSPRNMYQCQMGKQTMGTPCHNWLQQAQNKMYRLTYPASPLFRPAHYDTLKMDDFPMGTNAVIAVLGYTGYDMEDAIIINRASVELGMFHGAVIKTQFINLDHPDDFFCMDPKKPELADFMDNDGLPFVGRKIKSGEPLYCYYSNDKSQFVVEKLTIQEDYMVEAVKQCSDFSPKSPRMATITYRISRNPSVGDKFASRAGQKGILSRLYDKEDLPFSETGMIPDIIFNPHGFPSRMTVAMMIEVMAGKSAAVHGLVHDATPFRWNEQEKAVDYFANLLQLGGYNSYGLETFYSGIDGQEMTAQVFTGIVHYQRLRHMVSDKFQVRPTGPIDLVTRQPIKGRKKGGAVRFGEMERDCLIAHGTSFLLQDRLLHNSDETMMTVCTSCETMISTMTHITRRSDKKHLVESKEICRICGHGDDLTLMKLPYVFKLLVFELAAIGVNIKMCTKKHLVR